jgi:hypothetical protein
MNPFSLKSIVKFMAKGNLSAMELLTALCCHPLGPDPWGKLVKSGLVGAKLHILWDICDRDIEKVVYVLNNCPTRRLVDSCDGNEHWGKSRLAEYLNNPAWDCINQNKN